MTTPVTGSATVGGTVYPVSAAITLPAGGTTTTTSAPSGALGPYRYAGIVNSNGYNTYVANNMWGANAGTTQSVTAYNPGNWWCTASAVPNGYSGVQTYPNIQQLFNDWTGAGWNAGPTMTETPIASLKSLTSTYAESMGDTTGVYAEAAYDLWTSAGEIMIWVDTTVLRGAGGAQKITTGTLGPYPFTFYQYPSAGGTPMIIFDHNTPSGTVDILAALNWLVAQKVIPASTTIGQLDFGWEICSTAGRTVTFTISNYTISATV